MASFPSFLVLVTSPGWPPSSFFIWAWDCPWRSCIMRKVFEGKQGIQLDEDHFLTDLMFADDSSVLANNDAEATDVLYNIAHIAQSYGLQINAERPKYSQRMVPKQSSTLPGSRLNKCNNSNTLVHWFRRRKWHLLWRPTPDLARQWLRSLPSNGVCGRETTSPQRSRSASFEC